MVNEIGIMNFNFRLKNHQKVVFYFSIAVFNSKVYN